MQRPSDLEDPDDKQDGSEAKSPGEVDQKFKRAPSMLAMRPVEDRTPHGGKGMEEIPEQRIQVYDEMTYKPEGLLSVQTLLTPYGSVWTSVNLWRTVGRLLTLSFSVAVVCVLAIPDPASLRVEVFIDISKFLSVFCGLLLGFFMRDSAKRWHSCANCFFELCDAIRNMQMQFHALGVAEENANLCIRYGLLSGWLLKRNLEAEQTGADTDSVWQGITAESNDKDLGFTPMLLPREAAMLREMKDPAAAIWTWTSSLIGRMAQDGEIPAMQTPTYGRIMNLCQSAYAGIRGVRASISVQQPFVYVQMLTSLVHINNILNAINLGIVIGVATSGFLIRRNLHYFKPPIRGNQNERDVQFCLITFIICAVGPMLYQALTEISISLSQPFATDLGRIPIHRILMMLEHDLQEGKEMSDQCPKWERAYFKQRPPA